MSEYKVVRDKLIKHKGVLVDSRADGSVHIQLDGRAIDLAEAEAGVVYSLLSDVTEYVGHMTEGQLEKASVQAEAEDNAAAAG